MLCHRCGSHVPREASTCENCGASLKKPSHRSEKTGSLVLRRRRRQKAFTDLPYRVGQFVADRYRVHDVLGVGALGAVYKAHDEDLDLEVALKIILPKHTTDPQVINELRKNIRRASKFSHPNIVKVFDEGVDGEIFYFSMQHLEGLTLRKIINLRKDKNQVFTLREVEPIITQIGEALEYAHTTSTHGYLKPQNIIVLPDLLKLTDFGTGLSIPPVGLLKAQKNQPDSVPYLSPEFKKGGDVDGRADIYSLGVLLAEMLTGQLYEGQFQSINDLNPECHPLMDIVFRRAVADDPEERYQHILSLLDDITGILEDGELAEDEETPTIIVGANKSAQMSADLLDKGFGTASVYDSYEGEPLTALDELEELDELDAVDEIDSPTLTQPGGYKEKQNPKVQANQQQPPAFAEVQEPPMINPNFLNQEESTLAGSPPPAMNQANIPTQSPAPATPMAVAPMPAPQVKRGNSSAMGSVQTSAPAVNPPPPVMAPMGRVSNSGFQASQPNLAPLPVQLPSQPAAEEEDAGFSRVGLISIVLAVTVMFSSTLFGLYFKFVYVPNKKKQKLASKNPLKVRTTPTPRRNTLPPIGTPRKRAVEPAPRKRDRATPPPPRRREVKRVTPPPPRRKVDTPKPRVRPIVRKRPKPIIRKRPKPRKRKVAIAKSSGPCPRGMAHIRSGSFRMGSPANDDMRNFTEPKNVWTKTGDYCIDRYEYPGRGRRPKVNVSWFNAKKACESKGKRLCTEKEWERACKGGRSIRYPYGQSFDKGACNTRAAGKGKLSGSGRFRRCRSRYGVYDMSGNAAEWTASRFSSSRRVIRGGAYNRPDWDVRCASRGAGPAGRRKSNVGFRCCKDPKE